MMQARKYVIGLVMSVKQRRNLNSARGVELETFGFGTPMLYLDFFHTRVPIQTLTALQISDSSLYKISKSQKVIRENERNYRDRIRGSIQKKFFQADKQILKLDNLVLSTESMM